MLGIYPVRHVVRLREREAPIFGGETVRKSVPAIGLLTDGGDPVIELEHLR